MNSLDRIIKRERKRRYKRLKKLFKVRDMASKYINARLSVSFLDSIIPKDEDEKYFTGDLAKVIVDTHNKVVAKGIKPPVKRSTRNK